jgi:hypothetical protein
LVEDLLLELIGAEAELLGAALEELLEELPS